ncbi:FUSC family protein [Mycobacterium sp. 21AC1]|uniref:FUSC family protein n=1 Tax=[Mycobacterium] appelbergii TaxID=2939269 RepID=UPI0029393E79|nr:FUSC family protein [Mycobacterium sp. 21AC1]MDV3125569.1 FUSC family protein [Mycobacterium sp. 21AC1]
MTGPEDSHTGTRPISVAELLAKNGTIGAPPVGGRRRRRRGNSDSVTVAELTGEIPIIGDDATAEESEPDPEPEVRAPVNAVTDTTVIDPVPPAPRPQGRNGAETRSDAPTDFTRPDEDADYEPADFALSDTQADFASSDAAAEFASSDAEADYEAHVQARDAEPEPVEFKPAPRRPRRPGGVRNYQPTGTGAERMSPDPLDDIDGDDADLVESGATEHEDVDRDEVRDRPSYGVGPLFGGGQSVADDIARRGGRAQADDDTDLAEDDDLTETADEIDEFDEPEARPEQSPLVRGLWVVGQCIIAVAFGAGLFVAFDQLWKWNTIVALVLGVLVILGLAGGVRVVRKTEDIGSTLTAVAVGALVTFGPLALLQAS